VSVNNDRLLLSFMHPLVGRPRSLEPLTLVFSAPASRPAQVRNLYRRILTVGRDYPAGLDYVRKRAKAEFAKRKDIQDEVELKRAINYGRYMVKEMVGIIQLKKYRSIRSRYREPEPAGEKLSSSPPERPPA
jgi:hypothetical protein